MAGISRGGVVRREQPNIGAQIHEIAKSIRDMQQIQAYKDQVSQAKTQALADQSWAIVQMLSKSYADRGGDKQLAIDMEGPLTELFRGMGVGDPGALVQSMANSLWSVRGRTQVELSEMSARGIPIGQSSNSRGVQAKATSGEGLVNASWGKGGAPQAAVPAQEAPATQPTEPPRMPETGPTGPYYQGAPTGNSLLMNQETDQWGVPLNVPLRGVNVPGVTATNLDPRTTPPAPSSTQQALNLGAAVWHDPKRFTLRETEDYDQVYQLSHDLLKDYRIASPSQTAGAVHQAIRTAASQLRIKLSPAGEETVFQQYAPMVIYPPTIVPGMANPSIQQGGIQFHSRLMGMIQPKEKTYAFTQPRS